MLIIKSIDPFWFLASLFLGLFLVYCTTPNPDVIIKYPTPLNADKSIFNDDADNCYKFTTQEVNCKDFSEINEIPIQRKSEYFQNYERKI